MQDVASGMQKPPHMATDCPNQDITGVRHRLENLTGVGFCRLCYALGGHCGCSRAAPQAPPSYMEQALWAPPQPSYASMASSTMTTTSTSMRGVSPTAGPPPGFPAQTREQGGHQEPASHPRARRDRSSTPGPKK